jgi:hypothetical protein
VRPGAIAQRRMCNLILIRLTSMERHGPRNRAEAEAFLLTPFPARRHRRPLPQCIGTGHRDARPRGNRQALALLLGWLCRKGGAGALATGDHAEEISWRPCQGRPAILYHIFTLLLSNVYAWPHPVRYTPQRPRQDTHHARCTAVVLDREPPRGAHTWPPPAPSVISRIRPCSASC